MKNFSFLLVRFPFPSYVYFASSSAVSPANPARRLSSLPQAVSGVCGGESVVALRFYERPIVIVLVVCTEPAVRHDTGHLPGIVVVVACPAEPAYRSVGVVDHHRMRSLLSCFLVYKLFVH